MSIQDRARERAAQEALNRSTGGTCDDSQCVVHIINAAHFGFDAGREAAKKEISDHYEPEIQKAIRLIAESDPPNECVEAMGILMRSLPLEKQPDLGD